MRVLNRDHNSTRHKSKSLAQIATVFVILIFLAACRKKTDPIIGTWTGTTFETEFIVNGSVIHDTITDLSSRVFIFGADGYLKLITNSVPVGGKTQYSISQNVLTLTPDPNPLNSKTRMTITSLTDHTLSLVSADSGGFTAWDTIGRYTQNFIR
ncbi:MAG: hypothetical protein JWO03_2093 [Bacteroidetes bacterium]|nr:hypothetical protein [Bacteroidota bacterium]